jgi:hypothetical protein
MAFFGPYPYWGLYNPNFTYPILQSDYKISGLFNEYDELNDLAIKNNMIYAESLAENCKDCNSRDIKTPNRKYNPYYNYYPYYNYPYYNYPYYKYPYYHGYPYYNYPYRPSYFPYYL